VERSILAVLTPVIDPLLGPFSYAYRPGLGVADATVRPAGRRRRRDGRGRADGTAPSHAARLRHPGRAHGHRRRRGREYFGTLAHVVPDDMRFAGRSTQPPADLVNAELRPEHGHREESIHGVLLAKAGKEILVAGYERRMLQHTKGALPGLSGSLRRHLYRQAERVATYIRDPDTPWTGMSWR
jgi:CRISPR associated protein Cas1